MVHSPASNIYNARESENINHLKSAENLWLVSKPVCKGVGGGEGVRAVADLGPAPVGPQWLRVPVTVSLTRTPSPIPRMSTTVTAKTNWPQSVRFPF